MVNGQAMILPNNMADQNDISVSNSTTGRPYVFRNLPAVPGRWGEPASGSPVGLPRRDGLSAIAPRPDHQPPLPSFPSLIYNNPVRAGISVYINGRDQRHHGRRLRRHSTRCLAPQFNQATLYYLEPAPSPAITQVNVSRPDVAGVQTDTFDSVGQRAVSSERIRQFVTPIDPGGVGRIVGFLNRPNNDYDYGNGYDTRGRASYFRYFRPGLACPRKSATLTAERRPNIIIQS